MANSAVVRALTGLGRRLSGKPRQGVERELPRVRLGTDYGGYAVLKDSIQADSIVYSCGIGEDISFDLALIKACGCEVFGFDPTPRSIAWVRAQDPPATFHVREVGVAGYDGKASFAPPRDPAHISHSMSAPSHGPSESRVELEVRRLSTLMKEHGHERLDLLKMDVEGAEYDVIEDLLSQGLRPAQFLVEFHHGMHGIRVSKTEAALAALSAAGYVIFDAQPTGHEFSLVFAPKGFA